MASFISWGNQFYTIIRAQLDMTKEPLLCIIMPVYKTLAIDSALNTEGYKGEMLICLDRNKEKADH